MATFRDARSILDVFPENNNFTCVGTTLQGRRCKNSVNIYDLGHAGNILDELPALAQSARRSIDLLPTLKRLAELTLCKRWHRERKPQVDPVAQRWLATIQSSGTSRSSRTALLTPPATPPPITRQIRDRSTAYLLPPPAPNFSNSTYSTPPSSITSSTNNEARAHTQQRPRAVNINFNIAVDSNQIIREHRRATHHHGSPSSALSSSSSSSSSSRSDRSSSSRSTSSSSSSSSSNSQVPQGNLELQIEALQRQVAALSVVFTAQAQSHSSRSSRSSSRSINPGSPVPSVISDFELPPPRIPTPAVTLEILSESEGSDSDGDLPAPGSGINTPSSSGRSSPVVVSPRRSPARSAAPSPSSASSASSVAVQRRPIRADTTCYVCYESITSAADAAWCRASCGQNICLTCFAEWITEQASDGRRIACGLCRAPWRF